MNKNTSLTELKELIKTSAFHPFLNEFLEVPKIDEDKLLLLLSLFNQLEITDEQRKTYILSTMLIQMALDIHENVNNLELEGKDENEQKDLQLTVLAGDFYSGLYYQLLSRVGNISLVRVLASAIKDINEHKILLYQKSMDELASVMDSIRKIEASLILHVADWFNLAGWKEISTELLLLNRLYTEKVQYMESGQSIIFEILKKISFPKKDKNVALSKEQIDFLLNKLDQCILYAQNSVKNALEQMPLQNCMLRSRISSVLDITAVTANSLAEEG
ncbi:heptaprenyl diphosphate synthase component 1 [Peribacillus sp. SCS-155]|uniref:heptaprenyl diphosphate synthase component 1 n=1 Tax=Peribacillus sedimenti TaxID=3115297 RepID=UPI0039067273